MFHTILTGIDIVEDQRLLEKLHSATFIKRVFIPYEIEHYPDKFVSIFAIKEAVSKAFSFSSPEWQNIAVSYASDGKPCVTVNTSTSEHVSSIAVSVSHAQGLTIAIAQALITTSTVSSSTLR